MHFQDVSYTVTSLDKANGRSVFIFGGSRLGLKPDQKSACPVLFMYKKHKEGLVFCNCLKCHGAGILHGQRASSYPQS